MIIVYKIRKLTQQSPSFAMVLIFKHSTRCRISKMVLRRFEKETLPDMVNTEIYLLDLIRYREISDKISEVFNLKHQSPQLILIKKGSLFLKLPIIIF
ncbi:MAG: bacillithiol system redox-active protein YtxJ [Flavobacteriia bacterium]|nr:MAG: bacillithiol system redox-active protein YtxJ [Flavobacteriia bacterium]